MDPNDRQFIQGVYYNCKPDFYEQCQVVGQNCKAAKRIDKQVDHRQEKQHMQKKEPKKVIMEWRTKGPIQQEQQQNTAEQPTPIKPANQQTICVASTSSMPEPSQK